MLGRVGLSPVDDKLIRNFLKNCVIIDLTPSIKDRAIKLKQIRKTKLPDALIAATAQHYDLTLLTADAGFRTIPELDIFLLTLDNPAH